MKTALILDFGGVISRTMFEEHRRTEQMLGLSAGTLQWRGPFAPDDDPLWRRMLAGEITEREYWRTRAREVGALIGETWTDVAPFVRRARGDDLGQVLRPEALETIRRLKAGGVKLAVLSNELDLFYGQGTSGRVTALTAIDAIIDATYTGILKPDARSYQRALAALDVDADEAVFVDDQQPNVHGAEAVGIAAVAFDVRDPEASFARVLSHFPQVC